MVLTLKAIRSSVGFCMESRVAGKSSGVVGEQATWQRQGDGGAAAAAGTGSAAPPGNAGSLSLIQKAAARIGHVKMRALRARPLSSRDSTLWLAYLKADRGCGGIADREPQHQLVGRHLQVLGHLADGPVGLQTPRSAARRFSLPLGLPHA